MILLVLAPLVVALVLLLAWVLCAGAKAGDEQEIVDEERQWPS